MLKPCHANKQLINNILQKNKKKQFVGGLAVDDGVVALAIDVPNDNNLNTALLYSPIKPNTKHIACQLVRCEKTLDEPVEYRFSI